MKHSLHHSARRVLVHQGLKGLAIGVALILVVPDRAFSRQPDWKCSLVLRGSYTTTSKLFLNPESPDADVRSESVSIDGILGGGAEFRVLVPDFNIFIALSVEYNSKDNNENLLTAFGGTLRRLPVTEGLHFIPVELTANAYIPLNSETIQLTMGGGIGAYYATRTLRVAGVDARVVNTPLTFGINVGIGLEYTIWPHVSLQGEMKFRDPEIVNESKFSQDFIDYGGSRVFFPTDPLKTKIDVDGMSFMVGMVVELF